jgi:ferritin-like metal-binding protein YciE
MAEDAKQRTTRYLTDSHASELGGIAEMQQVLKDVTDPDAKAILNDHITAAQIQADRLEARITALGSEPSKTKAATNTVIAKVSHLSNAFHDLSDKQTQDVIKLIALAHLQAGAYSSLNAFAKAVGDTETADLAETLMQEDIKNGEQLLRLVPQLSREAISRTSGTGVTA